MDSLGTILPTASSMEQNKLFADAQRKMKDRVATHSPELRGTTRRVVGGEVRYYDTTDQYAIVSRSGKVLWFAVTPNGDFRI